MMKKHLWLILIAVAFMAILPALAGSDHAKCKYSTQECLDHMAASMKSSGWVGVELDTDNADGYAVTRIFPGSPAESAGLQQGDVLVALNGVAFKKENDEALHSARKEWKPGQVVTYTVKRGGGEQKVNVTLGAWPADVVAKVIGEHMLEHASGEIAQAAK